MTLNLPPAFSAAWIFCVSATLAVSTTRAAPPEPSVDALVAAELNRRGLAPASRCDDAVFLRRVFLDMTGTLPRAAEAKTFLDNPRPDKRAQLVERLFRHDAFADFQAMHRCDLLRVKSEFPSRLWPNAVQAYQHWITTACRDNLPADRFARELLTASGSNFRDAPVNFYRSVARREPAFFAEAAALTFMGIRPEHLTAAQRDGMAPCFAMIGFKETAEWKEEIVFFDRARAEAAPPATAVFPDGKHVALDPARDPREAFADWLTAPDNPWFARCTVNRLWHELTGRGLVHPPDDLRPDNPPSCPALLDFLARELVDHHYDLRHLMRLILNSETYQRSSIPPDPAHPDPTGLSHHLLRRLDAEVLIDAINQVTGTRETYSSEIPEPFTYLPASHRATALADGSISSPFLDLFGRPPRDTGLVGERNNEVSDTQMLHLLNSTHIQQKIENGPAILEFHKSKKPLPELIAAMYLAILSRPPGDADLAAATDHFKARGRKRTEAVQDLAWALLNSREFLYLH